MTDTPDGPGWWQASDLKWYPPELQPDYEAASAPDDQSQQLASDQPPGASPGPGWWQASDLKWYPPELDTDYEAPAPLPSGLSPSSPPLLPALARRQLRLRLSGTEAIILVIVLIAAAAGITSYVVRARSAASHNSTAQSPVPASVSSAQPGPLLLPTSTTSPPPHLVSEAQLDGLLLSPHQIGSATGATGIAVFDSGPSNEMWKASDEVADKACLPLVIPTEVSAYAGSRSDSVRNQMLADDAGDYWTRQAGAGHYVLHHTNTHWAVQAVVVFSSEQDADAFFTASAQSWPACANRQYSYAQPGFPDQVWTVGPVSKAGAILSATESLGGNWLWESCQRALTVANNVVIDVEACSKKRSDSQSDSAINIAREIAANVPTQ